MQACPLCQHQHSLEFYQDKFRYYYSCQKCHLIYVDSANYLTSQEEKAHYDNHNNRLEDAGYRSFLSKFSVPLLNRLGVEPLYGLDFGCGPGPLLAQMMREAGHHIEVYDIYYAPDKSVLKKQYDFVSCTEAIEHFHHPKKELELLLSLVKPNGWLGIMTKLAKVECVKDVSIFANWHYKNDLTHVIFFSKETFEFIAEQYQLELEFVENDVILLRKRDS